MGAGKLPGEIKYILQLSSKLYIGAMRPITPDSASYKAIWIELCDLKVFIV